MGGPVKSTVRYLGIEVDDALAISEQVEVLITGSKRTCSATLLRQDRPISRHNEVLFEEAYYYRLSLLEYRFDIKRAGQRSPPRR
jgi:hypothetical protein